jgi:pimeloyl-ACP methyl ester carboxylesterase
MRRLGNILVALLFILHAPLAQAQVAVLIHGYLGSSQDWRMAITGIFEEAGWQNGGHWPDDPAPISKKEDVFYTVALLSHARLLEQASRLREFLHGLTYRHPDQELVLIGHSAGGVIGRLVMVQERGLPVQALITIASPHLGSDLAEIALLASESPLAEIAPRFGINTLSRSRDLYLDLLPERPGNFLYWLNRQPHPPARYISLIRESDSVLDGDLMVPSASQDLRAVWSLGERAMTLPTSGRHDLTPQDGHRLLAILNTLPDR